MKDTQKPQTPGAHDTEAWQEKATRLQESLGLSPRRAQVLSLLHDGAADKAIADKLHLTGNTLRAYLTVLFADLGVNTRGLAMLSAERALALAGKRKPIH
jgi:DNA-binding NarL/FixJ family response regulator